MAWAMGYLGKGKAESAPKPVPAKTAPSGGFITPHTRKNGGGSSGSSTHGVSRILLPGFLSMVFTLRISPASHAALVFDADPSGS